MEPKEIKYKVFPINLKTTTELDGFTPLFIGDMKNKFQKIVAIKNDYLDQQQSNIVKMSVHKMLDEVVIKIKDSNNHINEIFDDFHKRINYITVMFLGSVNAGKTSIICDLSRSNPKDLTEIIKAHPDFLENVDDIKIGPNVETINLYEIMITVGLSGIRLVDVPGIGGVVHPNKTLAPFVDMADCIVFLIDANTDISGDEYNFLKNKVTQNKELLDVKDYLIEDRHEKSVLVVLNKWKGAYGRLPPIKAEEIFEKKKNWILFGKEGGEFTGIAELFSEVPMVVKATTSQRDDDTGEPYFPAEINEVVDGLKSTLKNQGAYTRLNRPRQIMEKELGVTEAKLLELRNNKEMEGLHNELGEYSSKIGELDKEIKSEMPKGLDTVETMISLQILLALKKSLDTWKPKVGLWNRVKMVWAKEEVQKELKSDWEQGLKDIFKKNLDTKTIERICGNEIKTLTHQISLKFRAEFVDASPELKEKIWEQKLQDDKNLSINTSLNSLSESFNNAVKKIENQVTSAILNLLTVDAVLIYVIGAILNPVGSVALIIGRWFFRDRSEKKGIAAAMQKDLEKASEEIAQKIREDIEKLLRESISEMTKQYANVISSEAEKLKEPLGLINDSIMIISEYRDKLKELQFED